MHPETLAQTAPREKLALMTKVARLYHVDGLHQPEIAQRLNMSQSRVSRLLRDATSVGIIRTIVVAPPDTHSDVEDAVQERFGLSDVVVAHSAADDHLSALNAVGAAGATYLEATLGAGERIGISSWSESLLAVVEAMVAFPSRGVSQVVQVIGGVGRPTVQVKATRLTERLAALTGAQALFLPTPGVVNSTEVRDSLLSDPQIVPVKQSWDDLTVLLLGIGSVTPSPLLVNSGNTLPASDLEALGRLGGIGDVCLRYFDAEGNSVESELNDRVVGLSVEQLRRVPRRVGVAFGEPKVLPIAAAARGGWINTLITDQFTAQRLLALGG